MLSLGKTKKNQSQLYSKDWDIMKSEQKDPPSENLLNLNLPHHNKYLPER